MPRSRSRIGSGDSAVGARADVEQQVRVGRDGIDEQVHQFSSAAQGARGFAGVVAPGFRHCAAHFGALAGGLLVHVGALLDGGVVAVRAAVAESVVDQDAVRIRSGGPVIVIRDGFVAPEVSLVAADVAPDHRRAVPVDEFAQVGADDAFGVFVDHFLAGIRDATARVGIAGRPLGEHQPVDCRALAPARSAASVGRGIEPFRHGVVQPGFDAAVFAGRGDQFADQVASPPSSAVLRPVVAVGHRASPSWCLAVSTKQPTPASSKRLTRSSG
jgi:hypothetical protein